METKKVNAEQIDTLFEFIEHKGVKFYDLQVELVDHFASAIEAKWEANPDQDFTVTMVEVYRSFNDYGFERLVGQKSRALLKRSWRMAWNYFVSYLSWPKVILTVIAIFTLHEVIVTTGLGTGTFKWFARVLVFSMISMGVYLFINRPRGKKFLAYNQTLLLLLSAINLVCLFFVYLPRILDLENTSLADWQIWMVSGLMIVSGLMYIGFFFYSRMGIHEELEKAYPKYVR
jgi:hypothetical protein